MCTNILIYICTCLFFSFFSDGITYSVLIVRQGFVSTWTRCILEMCQYSVVMQLLSSQCEAYSFDRACGLNLPSHSISRVSRGSTRKVNDQLSWVLVCWVVFSNFMEIDVVGCLKLNPAH